MKYILQPYSFQLNLFQPAYCDSFQATTFLYGLLSCLTPSTSTAGKSLYAYEFADATNMQVDIPWYIGITYMHTIYMCVYIHTCVCLCVI